MTPTFPSLRGPVAAACVVAAAAVASVDVAITPRPPRRRAPRRRSRSPNRARGSRPAPDSSWSSTPTDVPPGAQVAVTVHDALQSRTAFDASVDGDNLPPTRDRQTFAFDQLVGRPGNRATAARVPDQRTRRQRRVPARGRPPQRRRRVARALRDPRGRGPGRGRRRADRRPAAQPRVGVAAAGRARIPRRRRHRADQPGRRSPTWSRRGRLGRQATQLAANPDVPLTLAPSPRPSTRGARSATKFPELAPGPTAIRSTLPAATRCWPDPSCRSTSRRSYAAASQDVVTSTAPPDPSELPRGVATARELLQHPRRPEHRAPRTARRGVALASCRARACVSSSSTGTRSTPIVEKFTPAHPYKVQTVAGDDSSAATVIATDTGLEQFLTGDAPPALPPRTCWPGSHSSPASSRASPAASPSPTRPHWDANDTFVAAVLAGLRGNPLAAPDDRRKGSCRPCRSRPSTTSPTDRPCSASSRPTHRRSPRSRAAQYAQRRARTATRSRRWCRPNDPRVASADRALASSMASAWATPAGRGAARALLRSIRSSVDDVPQPGRGATAEHRHHHVEQGRDPDQLQEQREQRGHGPRPARQRPPALPRRRRAEHRPRARSTTRRCESRSRHAARAPPRC